MLHLSFRVQFGYSELVESPKVSQLCSDTSAKKSEPCINSGINGFRDNEGSPELPRTEAIHVKSYLLSISLFPLV